MSQFFLMPPAGIHFDSQTSPTFALTAFLPVVSLPDQYVALPRWVYAVCDRIGPAARQEYALLTLLVFRAFAFLVTDDGDLESVDRFLASLAALEAGELRERVLLGLNCQVGDRLPEDQSEGGLRQLLAEVYLSVGEERLDPDIDRVIALLANPGELKRFLISNLRTLWVEHLAPQWEKGLPAAQQQAVQVRRHFAAGDIPEVFRAVVGRSFPTAMLGELEKTRRVLFSPFPFYGSYCVCAFRPQVGELLVGYGVGLQPDVPEVTSGGETTLPGGLLPILEALADETRLQILALIRDRGQGSAQQFMTELGLSQPATSRHLRLLETTGLLLVERIDGIKWYRLNLARVSHLANALNRFLLPQS